MSTQRKNVSTLTSFVVSHVPKCTRLSLRLSARSKVTRVEFVRGEGEPGNEASISRQPLGILPDRPVVTFFSLRRPHIDQSSTESSTVL